METELRPMTLGEILDRTFQLYRRNFLLFTTIAVVSALVVTLWSAINLLLTQQLASDHHLMALRILSASSVMLSYIVAFIAAGLTFAALTFAVSQIYLGQPVDAVGAYQRVKAHLLRYAGLNLASVIIAWSPFFLLLVAMIIAMGMAGRMPIASRRSVLTVVMGLSGLAMLLFIPLCVWLSSRYSMANAAAISESLSIRAALKRSVQLSKGTRGRIILGTACIAVVQMVISIAALAPIFSFSVHHAPHLPLWVSVYQLALGFVVNTLCVPLYGIIFALFYYDARIRKEGFDVEWLLDRSGASLPSEGPAGLGAEGRALAE